MNRDDVWKLLTQRGFGHQRRDGVNDPVAAFQLAWNRGVLVVDGVIGPKTTEAAERFAADGLLSDHFSWLECRSKGDGTSGVRRELLAALEALRANIGRPLPLVSCYRDPAYNAHVGGAADSMHTFGLAADIPGSLGLTVGQVAGYRIFAGFGDKDGTVIHVDCRDHAGSNNHTPGAKPSAPARWHY